MQHYYYSTSTVLVLRRVFSQHAAWIGLVLRLFLAWFLPLVLDDGQWIPGVAYTDIDYHVFTDAAAYIQQAESPYKRTTYRYTPFLAQLLAIFPGNKQFGRYLFCVADALCGYMIAEYRKRKRRETVVIVMKSKDNNNEKDKDDAKKITNNNEHEHEQLLMDALWWTYNPLAINICTRGSAESFVVLLPVLLTVWLVTWYTTATTNKKNNKNTLLLLVIVVLAGICHGIAVHSKLYPVIYSLSYVIALSDVKSSLSPPQSQPLNTVKAWSLALLKPAPVLFGLTSAVTFLGCTALGVHFYGMQALEEGLLYHFSRVDHRHNYSMHWYWIYLARAVAQEQPWIIPWVGRVLLVPQLVILVYSSFTLAVSDLALALFVQTFAFVAFNKVVTAQYFTWYLCLLPLCSHQLQWTPAVRRSIVGLILAVLMWLSSAYLLEMQGWAVHRFVWFASVVFFAAEVNLLLALLRSASSSKKSASATSKKLE